MRFSASSLMAAAAAAVATVPAVMASPLAATVSPATADVDVPGNNPFSFCSPDYKSVDVLEITKVDLDPLPPHAGDTLTISATGIVKQTVKKGAYVDVAVGIGLIKIINMRFDLCDQIKNVDLECPVQPGEITISTQVDLPKEVPSAEYTVWANAKTVDNEPITCLTGKVKFGARTHGDL